MIIFVGEWRPTSHERMSGQPWDASYGAGPAPWDTGVPQPAVARLAATGAFAGPVLDSGCGTGENARLGRTFRTVLDCGLFHSFDNDERADYAASLASATEYGGTLYVLCFSAEGPGTGPHPVSKDELTTALSASSGWYVEAIEPERVQTRYHDDLGAPAWLATIERI